MKVKLRKWALQDVSTLANIISNKRIQDNLRDGIPFPYTESDAECFIKETLESDSKRVYAFAITADDVLAGSIAVYRQSNIHFRTGELGYYLGEQFWGKGIGSEAVRQICDYIFRQTDIIRIFAEPFAFNTASCRVLEKTGFQLEGVLRCNAIKNNTILDMKMYALIREQIG